MTVLNSDGVEIYYETHGEGPTILLSHGFSATSMMWQGQIDALSQNHRLVTWDMRGHGRSASPEDPALYSQAHTVADMTAILDHLNVDKAIIGGLSLGGYMSLAFHAEHPERVSALLIIDTGPGYNSDKGRDAWNRTAMATAKGLEQNGLAALTNRSGEMAAEQHRSAEGLALAARGMLTQNDAGVISSLTEIQVPSLVLVGEQDEPFLKATDYMAAKIPNATKVVIPDAGHAANIDQPGRFNAAVKDFLSDFAG
jgi:pimeloyl-ACP methyl ester carboxylesterase